jgi:hypothetical protein
VPGCAAIVPASERYQRYEPLKEFTALFRNFADAPHSAQGMLGFCNEYGSLRFGASPKSRTSEAIGPILSHHAALCRAVRLFDSGDAPALVQMFNTGWTNLVGEGWGVLRHELRVDADGKIVRVLVPPTLIHAMWTQVAVHVESGAKLLRCQQCRDWFRVGTGTGRRDSARYCSNRCRQAAFKARKEA